MANIGSLTANLGLESAAFVNNLSRSADAMAKTGRQMQQQTAQMQSGFNRVSGAVSAAQKAIVAVGSAYVIRALGNAASASIKMADELEKTSSRVGVSVEALQDLQFAAERTGGSAGQMTTALEMFNRNVGIAATDGGKFADSLGEMGIELRDIEGNVRPTVELFADYADAVASMTSPQEQAAATQAAFGRSSSDLLNLLGEGSQGIAAYGEELGKLGRITTDQAKAAAEAVDATTDLSKAWDAATSEIFVAAAPVLRDLAEGLTSLIAYFRDLPAPVQKFGGALSAVAIGVAALSPVLLPLAAGIAFLSAPVLAVAAAIVGVGGLVYAVWAFRDEIAGALTGAVSAALGLFTDLRDGTLAAVQGLVEGVEEWLGGKLAAALATVRAPLDTFLGYWESAKSALVGNSIVPDMIDGIEFEFARLDAVMVRPTRLAVAETMALFGHLQAPPPVAEEFGAAAERVAADVRTLAPEWEAMGRSAERSISGMLSSTLRDFSSWRDSLTRGLDQLANSFLDLGVQAALFGGGGRGGGGIFGALFGFASGGMVPAYAGVPGRDSVPAMLTPGEFVVNADATARHREVLEQINAGTLPGFRRGGLVERFQSGGPVTATMAALPQAGSVQVTVAPTISVSGTGLDERQVVALVREGMERATEAAAEAVADQVGRSGVFADRLR